MVSLNLPAEDIPRLAGEETDGGPTVLFRTKFSSVSFAAILARREPLGPFFGRTQDPGRPGGRQHSGTSGPLVTLVSEGANIIAFYVLTGLRTRSRQSSANNCRAIDRGFFTKHCDTLLRSHRCGKL